MMNPSHIHPCGACHAGIRTLGIIGMALGICTAPHALRAAPEGVQGPAQARAGNWLVAAGENPDGPGSAISITMGDTPVARLIHGLGQIKPYLHVYGPQGQLLTNPGIDAEGKEAGRFPHHRGIFIGWNKISSDLGNDDLWHLRRGEQMGVKRVAGVLAGDNWGQIAVEIDWNSSKQDHESGPLLVSETRTMRVSRSEEHVLVDVHSELEAARDLVLGGDLQHAGVHFRAHRDVIARARDTAYLWEPAIEDKSGRVRDAEMRWCSYFFPIGDQWFNTIQLNHPDNPTEELSWRDYGRFGFFFSREMKKGERQALKYRFIISPAEEPAGEGGALSPAQTQAARECAQAAHANFAAGR